MATVKKAAKTAKKAPQPQKKSPAKKAGEKPVAKSVKKAPPSKAAPKKAAPKKPAPAKAASKASGSKTPAKSAKPATKAVAKPKAAPAKAVVAKKGHVAAKPAAAKPAVKGPALKVNGNGKANAKPVHGKVAPAAKAPAPKTQAPAAKVAAPVTKPAPFKAAVTKAEPRSTVIAKPTPKPETKLVELKPIKTSVATTVKYEPDFKSVLDDPGQTILNAPTMRYSDAELAEFKDLIMRKLEAAKKELTYLQGLITRKDEMGGDESENRYMTMEDGSISMEREQLSQMASRQIQFIDHLEKALMRIENKTYGICRVTGRLIDKARLRAVPHATLSIEAKMGLVKKSENQNVQ